MSQHPVHSHQTLPPHARNQKDLATRLAIHIISSGLASLNHSFQQCLDAASLWVASNGQKLNVSKTKCMLLHSSHRKVESALDISLDGVAVEQVRVIKYLGILINDTLTWSDHVGLVCRKVSSCLNLVHRLSWFLLLSLLTYLKSYILPHFDYCDVVWSSCTQEESRLDPC